MKIRSHLAAVRRQIAEREMRGTVTSIILSLLWIAGVAAICLAASGCKSAPDHIDKMFLQIEARALAGAQQRAAAATR